MKPHRPSVQFGVSRGRQVTAAELGRRYGAAAKHQVVRCPHCKDRLLILDGQPPYFRHKPKQAAACIELRYAPRVGPAHAAAIGDRR